MQKKINKILLPGEIEPHYIEDLNALHNAENIQSALGYTPSDSAEVDRLEQNLTNVTNDLSDQQKINAGQSLEIEKLQAAAEGNLYMFKQNTAEAYEKTVPTDAMKWATTDKIGGKTLVWNQLADNCVSAESGGITWTVTESGAVVANGTATADSTFLINTWTNRIWTIGAGHKLYVGSFDKGYSGSSKTFKSEIATRLESSEIINDINLYGGGGSIITSTADFNKLYYIFKVYSGVTMNNIKFYPIIADLTAMFGAGNEPTAEEFRAMFPADYYPYSKPTLMNFSNAAVVSSTGHRLDTSAIVQKYFPDGMKSAGTVHDEIDFERMVAIKRVGGADETGLAYTVLDTPVETPITEAFDPSIEVEPGGTLTFENDRGADFHVPVPNRETFMIKTQTEQELFDQQKMIADLRAYIGLTDEDVLGLQVDYKNKTFTRLAGAVNLTAGADFDRFSMFGGRKRCNVADDGTIVAWYGDADYKEDGSMGQVMVYQPKFYYLVCPVVYDPIETGIGYHLRKANYYVSEKPRAGFRLHPAFYDANGNEIDYILDSAFEGSIWDADGGADGTGAYLLLDEQVMTVSADKFCSIAGAKPASGLTQNLTRLNIEQLAKNRGDNWHGDLIKSVSARQLLMMIELGMMNTQTGIGQGVVSIADNSAFNCSSLTGSTSSLGNGTGQAAQTINEKGGTTTTETANGKTAITWRGTENPWGNIWKFVYGINIWGDGAMGGGQPFICTDFNFTESKNSGNYEGAGFTLTNANGYISAMGYSTKCDWLFMASECLGNSSLPVGDSHYVKPNLNGYRLAQIGGIWDNGSSAGAFYWYAGTGVRGRAIGGRLVYVPTKDSQVYLAAIASWKKKMAA